MLHPSSPLLTLTPSTIVDVYRAALGKTEENVVVDLCQDDVLEEVHLEKVRGGSYAGVQGKKWRGRRDKDTPLIPMDQY